MVEVVGSIPAAPIGSKAISDKEIAFFIACFLGLKKGVNTLRVHQNVHRKLRKFGKSRAKMVFNYLHYKDLLPFLSFGTHFSNGRAKSRKIKTESSLCIVSIKE